MGSLIIVIALPLLYLLALALTILEAVNGNWNDALAGIVVLVIGTALGIYGWKITSMIHRNRTPHD